MSCNAFTVSAADVPPVGAASAGLERPIAAGARISTATAPMMNLYG
jgi:hypothetical protein